MKNTLLSLCAVSALLLMSCGVPQRESKASALQDAILYNTEEEYARIRESGFLQAATSPYSTFSIDVDAASYSNMRRMLREGQLPIPGSVRIEEWINYFKYSYPQPLNEEAFSINSEYGACPWNPAHRLLLIGLKGKEIPLENAPANNLVFLIDASGSMQDPDKLPLLKRAFSLLLPNLKSEDRISIVTYAGSAGLVLDNARGTDQEKIISALENLEAGGSTAGGEGINLAYAVAKENFLKKGNNRVILATDGDFNVGVSDEASLEKLIEEKRGDGIYLSVLGFGKGNIKDNKMELLADKGNGNYNYIDNFMEARKVLVEQFGGTLHTIAKDVKLQVEFNPAFVKEYRLIGYENRRLNNEDFNDDKKDAGELGAGHSVTALYEIVPAGSSESNTKVDPLTYQKSLVSGAPELATIKFRYKEPGRKDTVSKLIRKAIPAVNNPENGTTDNFRLASAVTEFGLLMSDSEFKGNASFDTAILRASELKRQDEEGYVAELVILMRTAKALKEEPGHKE